jgi:hypothetical protein
VKSGPDVSAPTRNQPFFAAGSMFAVGNMERLRRLPSRKFWLFIVAERIVAEPGGIERLRPAAAWW